MRIISSQSFFLYAARLTVISTVDSGVEKSPAPMAQAPLWWEISRLRATIDFRHLYLHIDTQPRSR